MSEHEPELWLLADGQLYPLAREQGRTNLERAQNLGPHLARRVLAQGPTEYAHVNPPHILAAIRDELDARDVRAAAQQRRDAQRAFTTGAAVRAGRRWLGAAITNYGGRP